MKSLDSHVVFLVRPQGCGGSHGGLLQTPPHVDTAWAIPFAVRGLRLPLPSAEGPDGGSSTPGELLKYDPGMDGFIRFKPQINVFVGVINQEEGGVVWLSGNDLENLSVNGLYEFIPTTQTTNHYFHQDADSITQVNKNLINSIDDRDSCLYLLTNDGLWMFDKSSN